MLPLVARTGSLNNIKSIVFNRSADNGGHEIPRKNQSSLWCA